MPCHSLKREATDQAAVFEELGVYIIIILCQSLLLINKNKLVK